MERLFSPGKVAVVGVSDSPDNLGKEIVRNLLSSGFPGEVSLYGTRPCRVEGMPVMTGLDTPDPGIDLCVVLTPARTVPSVIDAFSRKGCRRFVVESGGFSELGKEESRRLEEEVRRLVRERNLLLVGPNCIGIVDTSSGLATPFVSLEEVRVRKGGVSLLAQSGGVGLTYLDLFAQEGIGLAKFVSMGNKLALDEVDYLNYLAGDPTTDVILLYLESVPRGREFFEALRKVEKPVVVHKANVTDVSRRIAVSHTAALSTKEEFFRAAVKQAGGVLAESTRDALTLVKGALLPPMEGRDLAILSRSGGHAVIAADQAGLLGLNLPDFSADFTEFARRHYRAGVMEPVNPLDLGDVFDIPVYLDLTTRLFEEGRYSGILFITGLFGREWDLLGEILETGRELMEKFGRPVALVLLGASERTGQAKSAGIIPVFDLPEEGVRALSAWAGRG
ncbi:MAG: hypothetical protein D6713_10330 [Deltaproteobacteria bacterium]|nr:MAG: hypothetical protein D6713_10330 [Deltaproteobacteria bacterium]